MPGNEDDTALAGAAAPQVTWSCPPRFLVHLVFARDCLSMSAGQCRRLSELHVEDGTEDVAKGTRLISLMKTLAIGGNP